MLGGAQTADLQTPSVMYGFARGRAEVNRRILKRSLPMDMSKRIPKHEEPPKKLADVPSSFPSWSREALARKIQAIDGFSRREADMQIDALATEFRQSTKPRPTLHLPGFYRTPTPPVV